jgi:hypothetical protein
LNQCFEVSHDPQTILLTLVLLPEGSLEAFFKLCGLFTIAKLWKQPRCPTTDEWIKKMWSLYSYPYLNQQKPLLLPIIAYTLSTTKLEIRAK